MVFVILTFKSVPQQQAASRTATVMPIRIRNEPQRRAVLWRLEPSNFLFPNDAADDYDSINSLTRLKKRGTHVYSKTEPQ